MAVVFTVWSGLDYLYRFRHVFGGAPADAVELLAVDLQRQGLTLAVAESCTGGGLAARLTERPGSSRWFLGGVIAYSNSAKQDLLGVDNRLLERHGAVSAEVAAAMARGVRRRLGSDLGVAITGIAGPDADGTDKPVGLTHVWLAEADGGEGRRFVFAGDRWTNRRQAVGEALTLLLARVED